MTASDVAAWWGSVVATGVVAWDVYKWRQSRSRLRVSASPNMEPVSQLKGTRSDGKYVFVEVVNNGDKEITLTDLVVKHYKTLSARLRGKPSMQAVVIQPIGVQGLPFELGPGKRWSGLVDQAELEKKAGRTGYLFCGVRHSASRKAALARVRLRDQAF